MRKFFNGGFGLGATYWIGIFGVGVFIKIVVRFINKGFLTIQDDAKFAQLEMFYNVFLVALSIYMLLMVRAMIKAGFDGRRPGGWGWIGIALTIISAVYAAYVTVTVLFPSTATPRFMLEMELRQMNKQLPQDMGDGVFMTWMSIKEDELIYSFTIERTLDAAWRKELQLPMLENVDGQQACQDFQGYFKGGINAVVYEYTFDNDTVRQSIDGTECFDWLATR